MKTRILSVSALILVAVLTAFGALTRMNSAAFWNGTIDNSPIGNTTAAAGHFTTLNSSSLITSNLASSFASVNAQPTPTGAAGFTGYGKNGTGDMDFFAANSGGSPSFCWYYLLGASVNQEMCLNQNANLVVPNGSVSSLTMSVSQYIRNGTYTVATIPAASLAGIGGQVVISDCASGAVSQSICTGGGTNTMLGVSNGSSWSVH